MKKFTKVWIIASNKRKIVGTMLLFLCVLHPLYSQRTQTYSGSFKCGSAKYEYYDTKNGRVYHGDFSYSYSSGNSSIEINGAFVNDLRDGLWKYKEVFQNELGVIQEHLAYIEYRNGIRNGRYEYSYTVKDKETKESINLKTTTKNGLLDGSFVYDSFNLNLTSEKIRGYFVLGCRGGRWIFQEFKNSGKDLHTTQYSDYNKDKVSYIDNETGEKISGHYKHGKVPLFFFFFNSVINMSARLEATLEDGKAFPFKPSPENLKGILDSDKIYKDTTKKEILKQRQQQQQIISPAYLGGIEGLEYFLLYHARESATRVKVTKRTTRLVKCVIEANGQVTGVKIDSDKRDVANESIIDKEAIRIVKSMSSWVPAKRNEKNIRCHMTIKVTFLPPHTQINYNKLFVKKQKK